MKRLLLAAVGLWVARWVVLMAAAYLENRLPARAPVSRAAPNAALRRRDTGR